MKWKTSHLPTSSVEDGGCVANDLDPTKMYEIEFDKETERNIAANIVFEVEKALNSTRVRMEGG